MQDAQWSPCEKRRNWNGAKMKILKEFERRIRIIQLPQVGKPEAYLAPIVGAAPNVLVRGAASQGGGSMTAVESRMNRLWRRRL